jgi:chromosome segregation ATPase
LHSTALINSNDRILLERKEAVREDVSVTYECQCDNLRASYDEITTLHQQATEQLVLFNKLQEERFAKLVDGLSIINIAIGGIFTELKPGCECYINHATDHISLFSEGVNILTKYLSGPWKQV